MDRSTSNLMRRAIEDEPVTDRTAREYTRRLKSLFRLSGKALENVTPADFISIISKWATDNSKSPATIRLYRSAIIYWLIDLAKTEFERGGIISDLEEAYVKVKSIVGGKCGAERTSAKKLKYWPPSGVEPIAHEIKTKGCSIKNIDGSTTETNCWRTYLFVRSNLLLGLRPIEWFNARLATFIIGNKYSIRNYQPGIVVENAKTTYGRSNGPDREILLNKISSDEYELIAQMIASVRRYSDNYPDDSELDDISKTYYSSIRGELRRIYSAINKDEIPSPYSTRHQAIANAKLSGLTKVEIAAMFGHGSAQTHQIHYARKDKGFRTTTFRPTSHCLQQTIERLNTSDSRRIFKSPDLLFNSDSYLKLLHDKNEEQEPQSM